MVNFLKSNYIKFLDYCKKEYSDFPEVCDRIVFLSSIYLKSKYPQEEIFICVGTYKKAYHYWLSINNKILDLVQFQFTTSPDNFNNQKFCFDFDIEIKDNYNYDEHDKLNVELENEYFNKNYFKYILKANNSKSIDEYLN